MASCIRVALTTIRIRRWPVHRKPVYVTLLLLLASACGVLTGLPVVPVWAQGSAWTKVPTIVVVTPEHDPRLPGMHEARERRETVQSMFSTV